MDLQELRLRQIELSNELNRKLTEVYKWYYAKLDKVSDDLLHALHYDQNDGHEHSEEDGDRNGPDGVPESRELGTIPDSHGQQSDSVIEVESGTLGTKNWPRFWLHALLGCKGTRLWISDIDHLILAYLNDVRVIVHEANEVEESFELVFYFVDNPYFSNQRLSRKFCFEQGNITSNASPISWTFEDHDESNFFGFFEPSSSTEDVKMALAIKDRIVREPLKYVLRYEEVAESEEEEEPPSSDDSGSRYPFSWLTWAFQSL